MVKCFPIVYILSFFHIFLQTFFKLAFFLQILKVEHLSFLICGHQTWDLEGGGVIDSPSVSWFSSTPAGIGLKQWDCKWILSFVNTIIIDPSPPSKYPIIQPLHNPTIQTSNNQTIQTSNHPIIQSSKDPKIQPSKHPDIQTSKHPDIQTSRHPNIQTSKHPDIQTSNHPKIQSSKHYIIQSFNHPAIQLFKHPII